MSRNKKAWPSTLTLGVVFLIDGLRRLKRAWQVIDTSSIPIASAAQGLTEVQGYAFPIREHSKTIDKKNAVYIKYKIEQRNNKSWTTVWESSDNDPFAIVDSSGLALVHPKGAAFEIIEKTYNWGGLQESVKSEIMGLVNKSGETVFGLNQNKSLFSWLSSLRVIEQAILVGSPVYALGTFQTPLQRDKLKVGGYFTKFREEVRNLIKFSNGNRSHIKSLALHKAAMLEKTLTEPNAGQIEIESQGNLIHLDERELFISDCHQNELLNRMGPWNLLYVIGGAGLIIIGIYFLLNDI